MADNYLEKRYRDIFGKGESVDPETGYAKTGGNARHCHRINIDKTRQNYSATEKVSVDPSLHKAVALTSDTLAPKKK